MLTEANGAQQRLSALFGGNELAVAVRNRPSLLVKPGQSAQTDAPVVGPVVGPVAIGNGLGDAQPAVHHGTGGRRVKKSLYNKLFLESVLEYD